MIKNYKKYIPIYSHMQPFFRKKPIDKKNIKNN